MAICRSEPRCPVCIERDLEANHRAGSAECRPCPSARLVAGRDNGETAARRAISIEGGGEAAAAT